MNKTYELERKFLLKNIPDLKYVKEFYVIQYYLESSPDMAKRIRKKVSLDEVKYYYTEKKYNDHLEETEKEISNKEFIKLSKKAISVVRKIRKIYDGWEIDVFENISLIIAEKEIIADDSDVEEQSKILADCDIPDFISKNMILEVTDLNEFSNQSLALVI